MVNIITIQDFRDLELPFFEDIQDPYTGRTIEVPLKAAVKEEDYATDKRG